MEALILANYGFTNYGRPPDSASTYVLGHSDRELERLRLQAQLIDPITGSS